MDAKLRKVYDRLFEVSISAKQLHEECKQRFGKDYDVTYEVNEILKDIDRITKTVGTMAQKGTK